MASNEISFKVNADKESLDNLKEMALRLQECHHHISIEYNNMANIILNYEKKSAKDQISKENSSILTKHERMKK